MPSRGQSLTVSFVAWDNTANVGKTGDVANFTLKWIKDGTPAAPTNPATEVDAANAPGLYKLTLTGTECTCDFGTLAGKSSTSGIAILPISVSFEQLPTAAPNANGGLPILSVSGTTLGYTVSTAGTVTGLTTSTIAAAILATPGQLLQTDAGGNAKISLTQPIPTSNTAQTVGDALNAARAQGFGAWAIVGTTWTIYAADGVTPVRAFVLNSATTATSRT